MTAHARSFFRSVALHVGLGLLMLAAYAGTALAAGAASPDGGSLFDLLAPVLDALTSGRWLLGSALALALTAGLAAKYGSSRFPFLGTGPGRALLVLVGSFGGAVGAAVKAGVMPGLSLFSSAFGVALVAAGGYSLTKTLIGPLVPKLPKWLQPIANAVLWFFEHRNPGADAKAAGDSAVKEHPATGAAGVVGKPRELP